MDHWLRIRSRISLCNLSPREARVGRHPGLRKLLLLAALYVAPAALPLLHVRPCAGGLVLLDGPTTGFSANAQVTWYEPYPGGTDSQGNSNSGGASATASGGGGSALSYGWGTRTSNGGPFPAGTIWGGGLLQANASANNNIFESTAAIRVDFDARIVNYDSPYEQIPWHVVYAINNPSNYSIYIDNQRTDLSTVGEFEAIQRFLIAIDAVANPLVTSSRASAVYTAAPVGQALPGTAASNPLSPLPNPPPPNGDDSDDLDSVPDDVATNYQTSAAKTIISPVYDYYGRTDLLYFDPVWSGSYLYTVTDNLFTTLLIPDALPGGDTEFAVRFGSSGQYSAPIVAGTPFDFRPYVSARINWFELSGIDLDEIPDPLDPPFVTGLTFANDGIQTLRIRALESTETGGSNSVPEPGSLLIFGLSALGLIGTKRRSDRR